MQDSQGSLPRGVAWGHIAYIFSKQWCGTIHVKFCQSGHTLSLGVHVFFLGVSHIGTQKFMWLISGYSDHISPEQNQTFTMNHIVRRNLLDPAGSMDWGLKHTKSLIRQNIPGAQKLSLRSHPCANPRGRLFFGMCRNWATQACWGHPFLHTPL